MHRPRFHSRHQGFTIVELLVTLSIFVFMTVLVVSKYGTFNQSTFLTNTAYDVALSIHTAQTYGLSVKGTDYSGINGVSSSTQSFNTGYGIDMDTSAAPGKFTFFADTNLDGLYESATDQIVNTYVISRGAIISSICVGTGPSDCGSTVVTHIDISFKRPNPDAVIYAYISGTPTLYSYAQITLQSSDGSNTRSVSVRKNGQITVGN